MSMEFWKTLRVICIAVAVVAYTIAAWHSDKGKKFIIGILKIAGGIVTGFLAIILLLCIVGCDASSLADKENKYLNAFQQFEFECLISDFNALNDGDTIYWCWSNPEMSNEEINERNEQFVDTGIIPIFVDVCRDGSLYVVSPYMPACDMASNLNTLNTNSFSRVMFFVNELGIKIYGCRVSAYDAGEDALR